MLSGKELQKLIREILQEDVPDRTPSPTAESGGEGTEAPTSSGIKPAPAIQATKTGIPLRHLDSSAGPVEVILPDNVILLVNGEPCTGTVNVKPTDRCEVVLPPPRVVEGYARITKSQDDMEAFLELSPYTATRYYLADYRPQPVVYIRLREETDVFCATTYEEVLTLLAEAGVTYGVNDALIRELTSRPHYGTFRIASGMPPGEPVDEEVELFFPPAPDPIQLLQRDTGNRVVLNTDVYSVDAGAVLARKKPAQPGEPGISVTGRAVPARPPRTVTLVAGPGTELTPDGTHVVARISGRPCVEQVGTRYVFSVNPVLVYPGDVCVATGNIHFRGDIKVRGSVLDGATLYASGSAEIEGYVSHARVTCGGSLIVHSIAFRAKLQAGCPARHFLRQMEPLLQQIANEMEELADLATRILGHPALQEREVPLGALLLDLAEYRFPKLIPRIMELVDIIRRMPGLPMGTVHLRRELEKYFPGLKMLNVEDPKTLRVLVEEIRFLQDCAEQVATSPARVAIPYALNSRIEATGPVLVWGQGCYHTFIIADGDVDINGVFRGGAIESRGNVYINEAGSELGALTRIEVPSTRKVMIGFAHPGVLVRLGKHVIRFRHPYQNVKIFVDHKTRKVRFYGTKLNGGTPGGEDGCSNAQ